MANLKNIILERGSGGPGTTPQTKALPTGGYALVTVGGPTNTLGVTWTGANLKEGNLRLKAQVDAQNPGDINTAVVDSEKITIYYELPQEPRRVFATALRQFVTATRNRFFTFNSRA